MMMVMVVLFDGMQTFICLHSKLIVLVWPLQCSHGNKPRKSLSLLNESSHDLYSSPSSRGIMIHFLATSESLAPSPPLPKDSKCMRAINDTMIMQCMCHWRSVEGVKWMAFITSFAILSFDSLSICQNYEHKTEAALHLRWFRHFGQFTDVPCLLSLC